MHCFTLLCSLEIMHDVVSEWELLVHEVADAIQSHPRRQVRLAVVVNMADYKFGEGTKLHQLARQLKDGRCERCTVER